MVIGSAFLGFLLPIVILIALFAVMAVLVLSVFKKIKPQLSSLTKDRLSRIIPLAENDKIKFGCFLRGFLISGLLLFGTGGVFVLYSPIIYIIQLLLAFIIIRISKKDAGNRGQKAAWYFLGSFSALLTFFLYFLLLIGKSNDAKSIILHFLAVIALLAFGIFITRRNLLLGNSAATSFAEGRITKSIITKNFPVFVINYEYEFSVNGKTFKSINGESLKQKDKRGRELSGNQKVLYVTENPNISRLCAIDARHTNKTAFFILVAILGLALRCVCSTDIIPTVSDFPANFAEAKVEISEMVSDLSEWRE
ncbi:MAG: hypothetical protein IJP90_15695 [Treponema sp.]|nr:hypothetical protein [Treponema sp.]